jgi:hypothetical protein
LFGRHGSLDFGRQFLCLGLLILFCTILSLFGRVDFGCGWVSGEGHLAWERRRAREREKKNLKQMIAASTVTFIYESLL